MNKDTLIAFSGLVVLTLVGAALAVQSGNNALPGVGESPEFNKSEVLEIVERGAGQECEWETVKARSGRVDCIQEFEWRNDTYRVHDYFDINYRNGTVNIVQ